MAFSGRTETFLNQEIVNNSFFPNLSASDFQALHRVPSHYADAAILHHLTLSMGDINEELKEAAKAWQALGFETLEAVDADDSGTRATFYKGAIYYQAKAKLLRDMQTFSRRDLAENQAAESEETEQSLLSESQRLLRRVLNLPWVSVDVI